MSDKENIETPDATGANIFGSIDWGQAWIDAQAPRRKPDDSQYWDGRAEHFARIAGHSGYAATFIEYTDLRPGESVFDMGCGAGTLTLPLAQAGHPVIAADFSPQMLHYLRENAEANGCLQGPDGIRTVQASWEDDWQRAGITPCDVAIASRSLAVNDLKAALIKLDSMARRRVCLSVASTTTPRYDALLYEAIGRQTSKSPDYIYCYNILYELGIIFESRLITTIKNEPYASYEDACESVTRALYDITPEEKPLVDAFCRQHLYPTTDADGREVWLRDYELPVNWIFISWNKEGN